MIELGSEARSERNKDDGKQWLLLKYDLAFPSASTRPVMMARLDALMGECLFRRPTLREKEEKYFPVASTKPGWTSEEEAKLLWGCWVLKETQPFYLAFDFLGWMIKSVDPNETFRIAPTAEGSFEKMMELVITLLEQTKRFTEGGIKEDVLGIAEAQPHN